MSRPLPRQLPLPGLSPHAIGLVVRSQALRPDFLGLNHSPASLQLCEIQQVAKPLCASVVSSVKSDNDSDPLKCAVRNN